ncbi:pyrokinin-1 receptor-like [Cylas formicarius]|uniref:pyrokinin-1 receptor-like n=1 Tax=Cylas formicarius TaxID=197179 RepID=UPI0029587D90|nr:pyrokinin-1 receptor-like [Cylas formicarius]
MQSTMTADVVTTEWPVANVTASPSATEPVLPTTETMYPLELVIPFTIVYAAIFVTGVVGNISTCVVIAKNKSMHTATNYYLFSLAVSDMLLLISGLPPEMYRIWSPDTYIFGQVICFLQGFSAETSANATVLTITAFTAERYLAICHPFLSHTMSKLSRAIRIIVAIWVVALTLAVPQAIQFGIEVEHGEDGLMNSHCTVVSKIFDHAFEVSTIVFFVAPMTLITVLYILIGRQLKKSTAKRPSMTHNSNSATGNSAYSAESAKKRLRHTQAQNRVVKMLIAVVAAFFICWAPFHAQRLFAVYLSGASPEAQNTYLQMYLYLMYTSGVLYFLSTCINPLLYHIMSNKYRNAFKKTFHNFCHPTRNSQYRQPYSVRLTKKADFLGGKQRTAETKISSNSTSRLSPQTSETSFSSSKIEHSHALLARNDARATGGGGGKRGPGCSSAFKTRFLRMFKSSLGQTYLYQGTSQNGSHTISNSSLKDTDEMDMVCADLVKHMKQVNELL